MKRAFLLAGVSLALAWGGCRKAVAPNSAAGEDRVIHVDKDDPEMNAAKARARSEIDAALTKMHAAGVENFSVKVPIEDGTTVEYFWLGDVAYADGVFTGKIDNDPEEVHTVKLGDPITVKKEEIADWLYLEGGKMHGNYTMRVLLKQMSPEEADHWKKMLAD